MATLPLLVPAARRPAIHRHFRHFLSYQASEKQTGHKALGSLASSGAMGSQFEKGSEAEMTAALVFLTFSTAVRNTVHTLPSLKAKLHIWGEHIVLTSVQIPEPKGTQNKS